VLDEGRLAEVNVQLADIAPIRSGVLLRTKMPHRLLQRIIDHLNSLKTRR
jgi:hypothetical protein